VLSIGFLHCPTMRRWSGLVLIATLLWLGWLNWGKVVRGSTLTGRPQYPDIYDQEESNLSQLVHWSRIPAYGIQQRKRRGQQPPIRQCGERLPTAIQAACFRKSQLTGEEQRRGIVQGRDMIQKRSSPTPHSSIQYTDAYAECCRHGPCTESQLTKYCHHYRR